MNEQIQKRKILDDLPTDIDALDFEPYIDTIADILSSPDTSTPLTIGVFGTWGSGKTSLMRMVRKRLPKSYRTAWFDAWKYDRQEDLWRVLLLQVLTAIEDAIPKTNDEQVKEEEDRKKLADMKTALYREIDREEVGRIEIDGGKLAIAGAKGVVRIGLSFLPGVSTLTKLVEELHEGAEVSEDLFDSIRRERTQIHIDQIQFLENFHSKFTQLVCDYLLEKNQRLVVFVDDLDRCLPGKAVEVLEAIKLFLDVPGCIFVLGLDQQVVARGIEIKYKEFGLPVDQDGKPKFTIEGVRYLEKIIQLPFQIPPIEREDMSQFVSELVPQWPHDDCPKVFAEGLGDNPRQVKRNVNVFLLLWRLAEKRQEKLQGEIKPVRLAKVVALQHISPQLYERLKTTPRLLRDLERYYREFERTGLQQGEFEDMQAGDRARAQRSEPPPALAGFVNLSALRRVLMMHAADEPDANFIDLTPTQIRPYLTLTRRAEAPIPEPVELPRQVYEPELVRIPAGAFLMGSNDEQIAAVIKAGIKSEFADLERPQHSMELPEYQIGRYPLTNAEYSLFITETSYDPPRHWEGGQVPEDRSDHPVKNVTWLDGRAYCEWLSEKTGKSYRLPTEAEWEKAARGTDGFIYPWGSQFDPKLCNSVEGGVGTTTPVGQYSPGGDSPYGAADMVGNVWEWTHSLLKVYPYLPDDGREGEVSNDHRVLRGGSFNHSRGFARCAARSGVSPVSWYGHFGFRVVLAPVLFPSEL